MDAGLKRGLEAKVFAGERLTREDGLALYAADELAWLGRLAHHKRTELHGDRVLFTVDRHPAPTEACPAGGTDSQWQEWAGAHRRAHAEGVKTPATMLYGHGEEPRHRVDHLLRLRELQDETGGFDVFVPLPHQHDDAEATEGDERTHVRTAAPAESLKTVAISRLLLDNVSHVECLRALHGGSLGQLVLNFGADALDGSVAGEDAGATTADDRREDLIEFIENAGFQPVERDASFGVVREFAVPVPLAERRSEPQQVWA